jgi:TRAP-type C4-dicarboxylate transport system permease small subunit
MPESKKPVARGRLHEALHNVAVWFAYAGGAIVATIGIMSAVSIIGRALWSKPITGDFELVEIGIAVAGSLFLAYCQITAGNIFVDIFTIRASDRSKKAMDCFGAILMGTMFALVGWRAAVGMVDIRQNGETSMLMGFPIWYGYVGVLPGITLAAITAFAQGFGLIGVSERVSHE